MKVIVDMNLAPSWCEMLEAAGHEATHWSSLGPADAIDRHILETARESKSVVLTHDLDFGGLLAATNVQSPSVIQIRDAAPSTEACGEHVIEALRQFESELNEGAIVTIGVKSLRATILPLRDSP